MKRFLKHTVYWILAGSALIPSAPLHAQFSFNTEIKVIQSLFSYIERYYMDTVLKEELKKAAVIAILDELDPHSIYIPSENVQRNRELLRGEFEGIGIEFQILEDTIWVIHVFEGGPAWRAGMQPGDQIIKIDTENVAGSKITATDVQKKLKGRAGTRVRVTVQRDSDTLGMIITRGKVEIKSVVACYMVSPEIGYLKLTRFSAHSDEEVSRCISALKQQGMKNLILDLRGNSGGYLNTAVNIVSEFIPEGMTVVYTQDKYKMRINYSSRPKKQNFLEGRIAVLIDENSASASEIVAGALQDLDRAILIGRRSYGKALVQREFMLPDSSLARITVATYYTPSGRRIQRSYKNKREYLYDLRKRYKSGELFSKEKIKMPDTFTHFTLYRKRPIPEIGGIMPDVFVPLDTSFNISIMKKLIRNQYARRFTIKYGKHHRKHLTSKYPSFQYFDSTFISGNPDFEKFISSFLSTLKKDTVDTTGYHAHQQMVNTYLKALLAEVIYSSDAYYYVMRRFDPVLDSAITWLDSEKYSQIGLLEKIPP